MSSMTRKILIAAAAILTVGVTATACSSTTPATYSKPVASAGQDESYAPVPTPSASESPSPMIEKQTITETQEIPFTKKTVHDSSLAKGTRDLRTKGVAGVKTLTYRVTLTNGVETSRKLLRAEVAKKPVTQVIAIGTKEELQAEPSCDPNYGGACVPIASDVDCAGGSGNGPAYVQGPVTVIGSDIYDLDRDGDGVACDTN
jgi:resuscitation-promoting factor RpfB